MCPLSNVKLRVFDRIADHNLRAAARARGCGSRSTRDDPAYFGGYIDDNFVATFEALPQLGAREAYRLLRNGFEASVASDAAKAAWIGRLDAKFRGAAARGDGAPAD